MSILYLSIFYWNITCGSTCIIASNTIFQFLANENGAIFLSPDTINIKVDSLCYDTCNGYNNSFDYKVKLRNKTQQPLLFKQDINHWEDSGFMSEQYKQSDMEAMNPNGTAILSIHVQNTSKKRINSSGVYIVYHDGQKLSIPIHLKVEYFTKKCAESNHKQ